MKRHRYYPTLPCAHKSGGYCDDCWRVALARGLSSDEWAELHRAAAVQPRGTTTRGYPSLKGFIPAKSWNGTAVTDIAKAIDASTLSTDRDKCNSVQGCGAHGQKIVKTDGFRLVTTATTDAVKRAGLSEVLDTTAYVWTTLPASVDVTIRRVILICQDIGRKCTPLVRLTLEGADLIVSAESPCSDYASERIALVEEHTESVTTKMNARWLLDALRGPLQLGLRADKLMLRPASDAWRYVQMGIR